MRFTLVESIEEEKVATIPDIEKQKELLETSVYSIIEDYIGRKRVDAFGVRYNKEANMFVVEIDLVDMSSTSDSLTDTRDAMEEQLNAEFGGVKDNTAYFYIKAHGDTNSRVNKEEVKKKALELLSTGKVDWTERGFILPNGDLVDNGYFGEEGMPHWKVDARVINKVAYDNHLYYDDITDAFDVNARRGDLLADRIGCIRVNGYNENYIALPENRPTNEQLYTLEEWIDHFFSDVYSTISVSTFNGRQQRQYNDDEYTGRDVVNRIKRYYSSGTLYEALVVTNGTHKRIAEPRGEKK